MPVLANLLISLLGGLLSFFGQYMTRKAAFAVTMVAAGSAAFAVMLTVINGVISGLGLAMPAFMTIPASWVIPGNIAQCIAARVAAGVAIWAWRWQMNIALASAAA